VRKVCDDCSRPALPDELSRLMPDTPVGGARAAVGCDACRKTGYRGRRGIFELLLADEGVRRQIQARATAADITAAATAAGMRTLRDDGAAKVLAGITTVDEVLRVTMRTTL
jgi:type II secretory ATPase GspE/PulE/Tfp pilus assembly ATPase PilB-like protein